MGVSARRTSSSTVRDLLEHEILTGGFAPGQRLDEVQLATRFGVSRTPLREALAQLAATDLVETQPHRGTFVKVIAVPEMLAMFEVMMELEGVCARLAARRSTDAQQRELDELNAECEKNLLSGEVDEYYYANELFHKSLFEASGNAFLARTAAGLQTRLKPFRRLQLRAAGRMRRSQGEHRLILVAIHDRNSEEAERLAKIHASVQGDELTDFLAAISVS